jgi:ribonucleoside-diphosphate reductase alpha subunit
MAALGGLLSQARASYAFLHKAWLMLRSVGQDARLVPVDNKGLWQIKHGDGGDDFHPVVTGLQYLPGLHNTYCFTEPEQHAGVFNELLTGQCAEIVEYSDPNEIAVCNLASLCLPKFVADDRFDFESLQSDTRVLVRSLNAIIDRTLYARPEMKASNLRHRPIGIGVQGLADVFAKLHLPWESAEARLLNKTIFEHIYYAAVDESAQLAMVDGPYGSFQGSPSSRGQLQFDLWGVTPSLDWAPVYEKIRLYGLRNSLLTACMPTASTAQILGNNESIEPFTSNLYTRSVLSGEFQVVNRHLVADLQAFGLWNEKMLHDLVRHNGSVQNIEGIPDVIKQVYKTVWEIPQRVLMDMAADRGAFVCQSQSFNLHMRAPTDNQLYNALFYAWEKGLKTGMYYLRTRPAVDPIKFTLTPDAPVVVEASAAAAACARNNPGACMMCSA